MARKVMAGDLELVLNDRLCAGCYFETRLECVHEDLPGRELFAETVKLNGYCDRAHNYQIKPGSSFWDQFKQFLTGKEK